MTRQRISIAAFIACAAFLLAAGGCVSQPIVHEGAYANPAMDVPPAMTPARAYLACCNPHLAQNQAACGEACGCGSSSACGANCNACNSCGARGGCRCPRRGGDPYVAGAEGPPTYGEEEATIHPPHSRYHPVPTRPVFAPREEYAPPEPSAPHHGHHPLLHRHESMERSVMQPTEALRR